MRKIVSGSKGEIKPRETEKKKKRKNDVWSGGERFYDLDDINILRKL